MNIRFFTLACLFASALFPGLAGALDGTGSGTLEETILIKGCENGLYEGDVTAFSIHTLGDWSLSTSDADYAGKYTLKRVKKKKKQGYAFNLTLDAPSLDTLIDELGESVNQLCGRAPGTLAITQPSVTKFIAKFSTDRATLTLKLALAAKASDGTVTYSPKYNLLAKLAFTPTGGGIGGKVAGQVLAPGGQIAAAEPPGLFATVADLLLPPSEAAVSGLMKVPNGTPVELVHLGQAGIIDGVLATSKVYKGKYKFNLDRLGHFDAPDLAVRVSDRGVEMRAFLNAHTVNISPLSEAVFQLAIEAMLATPGALLEHFTFAELDDLYASVDLLTSLKGLVAVTGVDATVSAIKDLVAQDPGIVTFLTAIAEVGQTDTGPGDIGNLFPLTLGNTWAYLVDDRYGYAELVSVTGVREINGITASVVNYTGSIVASFDEYLEENSRGLYNWGNTDMEDFYTDEIIPYQQESFPIKLGSSLEIANHTNLVWADDLDGDGQYERFNISAAITTLGFESLSVPAGDFPVALKQQIVIKVNITLSRSGKHAKGTEYITQWLASGIGPVKISDKTTVSAFGKTRTETSTSVLDGYRVDGQTGGNVPAIRLFDNAAYDVPPAVATDGNNYLALSCRASDSGEPNGIIGRLISSDGQLSNEIAIAPHSCRGSLHMDVDFDGSNYLVIYRSYQDTWAGIKGVRVSPTGQVIDEAGGFIIYEGSIIGDVASVKVAFDGTNYMVVWPEWVYFRHDLFGAMVSQEGEVTPSFTIFSTGNWQTEPDIAFDGTNYLVVWQNKQEGGYWEDDIYAARISRAGVVLDPAGIPIVTLPGYQNSPQIAFDGINYMATWLDTLPNDPTVQAIYGRRLDTNGGLLDGNASSQGFAINTSEASKEYPALVHDGTSYIVVWSYDRRPWGIRMARVSNDGSEIDPVVDAYGNTISDMYPYITDFAYPATASNGDGVFVIWLNGTRWYGSNKIEGKFIEW